MEKDETQFDKNEGTQLVIHDNAGTINVHNHFNDNTKSAEARRENEKEQNKLVADLLNNISKFATEYIEMEKVNKKNTRKQ